LKRYKVESLKGAKGDKKMWMEKSLRYKNIEHPNRFIASTVERFNDA
jgi:hypothetical protein